MGEHSGRGVAGSAGLTLLPGVTLLHPAEAVFEAMLTGWDAQMTSRSLAVTSRRDRLAVVRRFAGFTNDYPWRWRPVDVEEWSTSLVSGSKPLAVSTLRNYQLSVQMFCAFLADARYGWISECEKRFGEAPTQICHEWNTVAHTSDYEGRPGRRPLTREELQTLFDYADDRVVAVRRRGRKGWLAAFRDATLFKAIYAWGLRIGEAARLETVDFSPNGSAPELGQYGLLSVRWGKAARGSPPRRRTVCTVLPWSVAAVAEWVEDIRPRYGLGDSRRTLWPTERGGRVQTDFVGARFGLYRDAAGLAAELTPHCLRHSYATHLLEDGFDPLFVQHQLGHRFASTTAIYTGVSTDYKNRMLREALDRAFTTGDGGPG